jgi:cytochrome o ubiquinol oxidase subunit 2
MCQDKMMNEDAKKAREMAMRNMPQQAAATRLAQANGEVCTTPNDSVKKK